MRFKILKTALLCGLLPCLLVTACKNKSAQEPIVETMSTPIYQTEEFMDFYTKFGKDTAFQAAHIVWPLEGTRAMKDSSDIVPPDFRWQRKDWVMHKEYNDMEGSFNRTLSALNERIVVEKIEDQSGQYTMERRFGKLSSGWHLIYYRELGLY